ncbi:hypothetical protein [Microbulbifer sp. JSM ZJ756]|uniref:hypothetical protein n=1 Tax=Microbulbifer sp. JSM ZJ756 TaxID=3376191 RepID=UPI0037ADEA0A
MSTTATHRPKPCEQACSKCGSADVARQFRARGQSIHNEKYDHCDNRFASGQCHAYHAVRDHIDHTCRCCGYRWQSLPLPKRQRAKNTREAA